jgi:hypothetical protein
MHRGQVLADIISEAGDVLLAARLAVLIALISRFLHGKLRAQRYRKLACPESLVAEARLFSNFG